MAGKTAEKAPPSVKCLLRDVRGVDNLETTFWDVRNGHEHASILVRSAVHGEGDRERTSIEVMIRSSFGSWGHYWSHASGDWREWMADTEFDYAMGKFAGASLQKQMSTEDAVVEAKRRLIQMVRDGRFWRRAQSKDAREMWNALGEIDRDYPPEAFFSQWDHQAAGLPYRYEMYDPPFTETDRQCRAFWDVLWTPWAAEISTRAKAEAA